MLTQLQTSTGSGTSSGRSSGPIARSFLPKTYPPISGAAARIAWAAEQSAFGYARRNSASKFAYAKQGELVDQVREIADGLLSGQREGLKVSGITANADFVNRLSRHCGVHSLWLIGADVDYAKGKLPSESTDAAITQFLNSLMQTGFPFDQSIYCRLDHSLNRRLIFSITRFELISGKRLDLAALARDASLNVDTIRDAVEMGIAPIRHHVRLAKCLNVSAIWLRTGHGAYAAPDDWDLHFALFRGATCQSERIDLAMLRYETRRGNAQNWSARFATLGISPSSISQYRNCSRRVSRRHAEVLAAYLDVDAAWLSCADRPRVPGRVCGCQVHGRRHQASEAKTVQDLTTFVGRAAAAKTALEQRLERPVTWLEIATHIGVAGSWCSMHSNGRRKATWHSCQLLAMGLDVNPIWLWDGTGPPERNLSDVGEKIQSTTETRYKRSTLSF